LGDDHGWCGRDIQRVPCLLALLALLSPRLALFALWIFSDVLSRAFSSWVLPLLGFFLLPWTTLAYAAFWSWGPGHHVTGFEWVFVALAFVIDLGSYGGGRFAASGR
jgi:apolipoprotein N-acyltransferase